MSAVQSLPMIPDEHEGLNILQNLLGETLETLRPQAPLCDVFPANLTVPFGDGYTYYLKSITRITCSIGTLPASGLGNIMEWIRADQRYRTVWGDTLFLRATPLVTASQAAAQVVAGSLRADIDALSMFLFDRHDYWSAARLNNNQSHRVGLTINEKCEYKLAALEACKQVSKKSQPGALGLQLKISGQY